jgi:Electron transfer DM13/PEP-CTERM motif
MKLTLALSALVVCLVPGTVKATGDNPLSFMNAASFAGPAFNPHAASAADGDALNSLAPYARAGWQAQLSTRAHNVRGTVTIIDADTFRVDNFFYDGGGINVHFILAASDNTIAFSSARLVTEPNLLGQVHNGDSITIDLPSGKTFDGYGAISLWCLPAAANFGSGSFASPVPEPATAAMLALGVIGLAARRPRRARSAPDLITA